MTLHGRQHAQLVLDLQRLVGEGRIAGAEDSVRRHVGAELGLERGLHINVREDAEALLLERRGHARHDRRQTLHRRFWTDSRTWTSPADH